VSALARMQRWATAVWLALAGGAGLGYLARDVMALGQPEVALAWVGGCVAGAACAPGGRQRPPPPPRSRELGSQRGQATVEWTALVLMSALALGALLTFGPRADARSFAGFIAHRFVCVTAGGCRDGDRALVRAYGPAATALVRGYAPNLVYEPGERQLPVDWRRCRRRRCADAPDERDLDVHRSHVGERATVFTHVLRRGGRTFLQYWLYFPDSNTSLAGSDRAWEAAWLVPRMLGLLHAAPRYPGYHRDDWEGYVVRLDPDGSAWVRAGSHGHWQGCKDADCVGRWAARTGWTRVSRGSHAGHIPMRVHLDRRSPSGGGERFAGFGALEHRRTPLLPGPGLHERTTTSEGLRLIPLEAPAARRDRRGRPYRPNAEGIDPPWRKEAYRDPLGNRS
jgi:hypothetical protein